MSPIPGNCHTDETVEGRKIRDGRGEDAKRTAPQTTAQTLNEELKDPSSIQSYLVPCVPALTGLTAGKLANRLTAKLEVVNLVHFTFNHICHLSSEPHICSSPSRK